MWVTNYSFIGTYCYFSGSGKTTLLNVLNFHKKKNLKVTGKIKINGKEIDGSQMGLISSYIQQEDLFYGTLTVREHLIFHVIIIKRYLLSK